MNESAPAQDPYSKRNFWIKYFESKSSAEIRQYWDNFEGFTATLEDTLRIAMSASRAASCRDVLLQLLRQNNKRVANKSQIELFEQGNRDD